MKIRNHTISEVSAIHYGKLVLRSLLLLSYTVVYLISRFSTRPIPIPVPIRNFVFALIWIIYIVEMILRFFPSRIESMGCQKQFAKAFIPTGDVRDPAVTESWRTRNAFLAWCALNLLFGGLYFAGIFDRGILLIIALIYSVCDMICILFFCPFQTFILKNKCCGTCRIYNWDYAMMFTPLIFIPSYYTYSLVLASLVLLVRWELTFHLHPERFSEITNAALSCRNCPEKLCQHKKQLQSFQKKNLKFLMETGNFVIVQTRKVSQDVVAGVKDLSSDLMENVKESTVKLREDLKKNR